MLVTTEEMFRVAREGRYAVPAPNCFDLDSMRWYIELAEELGVPVIVSLAQAHIGRQITLEDTALLGRDLARRASVPVALHLDHGTTPALIFRAVDLGFTSVMIDASMKPFAENVAQTREVVQYAHARGVVVEAEIGHVGAGRVIGVSETQSAGDASRYTTPEEARRFCEETGVDSLAVSIGTAHGLYRAVPRIDIGRLHEIAAAVDTPLVLHGGSSSGDENLRACAQGGICKINIYTDLLNAAWRAARAGADYLHARDLARQGVRECLRHYYEVFGTKQGENMCKREARGEEA